jgi:hypothetical protein
MTALANAASTGLPTADVAGDPGRPAPTMTTADVGVMPGQSVPGGWSGRRRVGTCCVLKCHGPRVVVLGSADKPANGSAG